MTDYSISVNRCATEEIKLRQADHERDYPIGSGNDTHALPDPTPTRLYTTAVVVIRSDTHGLGKAEDFQVFRAENMPAAALYARQHHERTHGKHEPVARVRVYHSCDTCPRADGLYVDHVDVPCCKYAAHGDCAYSGTHTEYLCSMI